MDGEAERLTSSASNKAHGQEGSGRGIKGRRLEGGVGWGGGVRRSGGSANEGWETRGREGKNVIKTGKREIGGREGNRGAAVIYASCIIFYSACPPPP